MVAMKVFSMVTVMKLKRGWTLAASRYDPNLGIVQKICILDKTGRGQAQLLHLGK
jgi:hypothetical protein